jgi:nitroimidazol reductase NimA-like FMN-containing flavoprotein (pyridoxamine 5'-phosphate oxidase superfamily)
MIGEMGEQTAREFLATHNLGRLGCCQGNQPYVVPVHYLLEGDCLYVHSLPGRKIEMLRANPHACLLVDSIDDDYHWRSVIANGHYEEVTDADERDRWLARIYAELPLHSPVESMPQHERVTTLVFRLRLTSLTGRFEKWV